YSTFICCRPYNAFSPVCYGSICCDGCCPLQTCTPPCGGGWGGGCGGCGFAGRGWNPMCLTPPVVPGGMFAPTLIAGQGACVPSHPYMVSPEPAPSVPVTTNSAYTPMQPTGYYPYYPGYNYYPMGYQSSAYAPGYGWGMPYGQ